MPDLTGSSALDVATGLAFVYTLFSLLCSTVQEAIAGILDLRSKTLEKGLKNLLDDGGTQEGGAPAPAQPSPPPGKQPVGASTPPCAPTAPALSQQMLAHGMMRTLYKAPLLPLGRRQRRGPSYIPSRASPSRCSTSWRRDSMRTIASPTSARRSPTPNCRRGPRARCWPSPRARARTTRRCARGSSSGSTRRWTGSPVGTSARRRSSSACCRSWPSGRSTSTRSRSAERLIHDDTARAVLVQAAGSGTPTTPQDTVKAIKRVEDLGLPLGWGASGLDTTTISLSTLSTTMP